MLAPEFILKTTPPRAARCALERTALKQAWADVLERTAATVVAPAGFGKTTLLAQWRSAWLKHDACVAWFTADARDDPARFTLGLLHALRSASGRPGFEVLLAQYAGGSEHHLEALTALLREIAHLGGHAVIVVDDAERLPASTVRESLRYLLRNAPANLHLVIGSRVPLALDAGELVAKGHVAEFGTRELRLDLDQSIAILAARFGSRLDLSACVRLHELVEGWPLGLQLAAATIEREPDLGAAVEALSARRGDIERYFFELLLTRVPARIGEFLVRVAMLGHLNADLCAAVTGCATARAYLSMLAVETPILGESDAQDGWRLHPLARDFLMARFECLPPHEREQLHARASHWYAAQQRFHEAACHALEAGDARLAHTYAAQALWTLTLQGQLLEAREWLARIGPEALEADIDLRLVGAWIMAIGEHNARALAITQPVLADTDTPPQRRFVAARAASTAVAYGDRVGLLPEIVDNWQRSRTGAAHDDPIQDLAYRNALAFVALHAGNTAEVRRVIGQLPAGVDKDSLRLPVAHRLVILGLSHLWDGNAIAAEAALAPALASAERIAGRRSMVASFHATVIAAALFEQDQPAAAQALLANRLDIIEHVGAPDLILLAYRTLAGAAMAQGDERRALSVLDGLDALSLQRGFPRLALHALADRIRIHALSGRNETVDRLLARMQALQTHFIGEDFAPFRPLHALCVAIASTHAALARGDLDACERQLQSADTLAHVLHRGRDIAMVKALRAVVAHQRDAPGVAMLLSEALGLAAIGGCHRLLADTHPAAVRLAAALDLAQARQAAATAVRGAIGEGDRIASRGGLLTGKEAEVLALLERGLSNKLIARALEISHETVKWHVSNLFTKLDAGTRQHAVGRARLLGLLAGQ